MKCCIAALSVWTALTATCLTATCLAGPVNPEVISGTALMAGHVDVDAALNSEMGETLFDEIHQKFPHFKAQLAGFSQIFGFNPLSDVHGLTFYSNHLKDKRGVLVADWNVDQKKLLTLLKINPSFQEHQYGDYQIAEWTDSKNDVTDETHYGCFFDASTAVMSDNLEDLKGAIDVLAGTTESLQETKSLPTFWQASKDAIFSAAMQLPDAWESADRGARMLQNVVSVTARLAESDSTVKMGIALKTSDPADAGYLRDILTGLVAAGEMLKRHDDLQWMQELVESQTVSGDSNLARLEVVVSNDRLMKLIDRVKKQQDTKKD